MSGTGNVPFRRRSLSFGEKRCSFSFCKKLAPIKTMNFFLLALAVKGCDFGINMFLGMIFSHCGVL